jgi:hypothetical protein
VSCSSVQHEDESGDEDFDEELEQVIQQEHSKFLQQQAEYYEQLQANRSWKVVPLASPGPAIQLQREEEKQQYVQSRQASGSITGAYHAHALCNPAHSMPYATTAGPRGCGLQTAAALVTSCFHCYTRFFMFQLHVCVSGSMAAAVKPMCTTPLLHCYP